MKTANDQTKTSTPTNVLKEDWNKMMGDAKVAWGKLTEDELLKTEGHIQKLTGIVQSRYAITREVAEKQVQGFLDKHRKVPSKAL
ncbi:CsbD family protein [Reinekea sp. G2M2-21]|jgi:uncharacterized protein YjbJ (UPF0337 family)|uniref:CsbD family protein n=1 Tax=Reinekea sp. G2M2-21 TaxID=2788942 RepID=UPI0018A913D3|nr:CsbD family protein [Reinekea sp. G2M2-21]MDX1343144.1 CsbD family protein [Reinekea sp.]